MKKVKILKGLSVLLVLTMIMLSWIVTPQSVFAASHTVSDGDSLDLTTGILTKADNSTQVLTINAGDTITVASGAKVSITGTKASIYINCGTGVTLTLNNVNIINSWQADQAAPLTFSGTNNTLVLSGSSTLKSYAVSWNDSVVLPAVEVAEGVSLTIEGSGALTAVGGGDGSDYGGAGIGGGKDQNAGTITINNGTITAEGGYYSAGIGAGNGATGGSGTIIINDGILNVTGGNRASGIGGGGGDGSTASDGGTITINGGTITTTSGTYGAGIGGGNGGNGGSISVSEGTITSIASGAYGAGIGGGEGGSGGTITISGGTIDATGAVGGAGIGGGYQGSAGTITISVGSVTATTANNGAGIGVGMYGSGGAIAISGGTIDATGVGTGAGIGGGQGTTCDSITISDTARVFAGSAHYYKLSASSIAISGTGIVCLGSVAEPINVTTSSHSHDASPVIDAGANTINGYSVPSSWTGKTASGYFLSSGNPHQVIFEENGGSTVNDLGVIDGSTISPPDSTRAGYDLAEWYLDPGLETMWNFDLDTVRADMTLYAKWIQIDLSSSFIIDDDVIGTLVGTVTGSEGLTLKLVDNTFYPDNTYFSVSDGQLMFADIADLVAKSTYTIKLRFTTTGGVSTEKEIVITVKGNGAANGGQANHDSYRLVMNTTIEINPEENDVLSTFGTSWDQHRMISLPSNGSAELGSIIYTPDPDFLGTDALTYIICDNANYCMRSSISFTVTNAVAETPIEEKLPATGFAPDTVTQLSKQGLSEMYQQYNYVSLEIPSLEVEAPIVGVPVSEGGWNLAWLGNQAGWLHGTAFPSWAGNSAITAHVYDANGQPGLFNNLSDLKWGDEVIVHVFGHTYVYEVRTVERYVQPDDTSSVFKHEDYPWLTLITCMGYDEDSNSYRWRVVVRAIQTKTN